MDPSQTQTADPFEILASPHEEEAVDTDLDDWVLSEDRKASGKITHNLKNYEYLLLQDF